MCHLLNSKWGYIDLTGKIKIGFKYDKITEFDHRGHALVQYDSKWGLIDQDDRIIIDFKFENIDFIKIDTEQYELQVVIGGLKTIKKHIPKTTPLNTNIKK